MKLDSLPVTMLLAAFVAMGPLATDMYLPALPGMADALNAGPDQVQLTLSVYLLGFALSQLIYGPLADRFGRKPVLLTGLVIFALASAGCALSTSIEAVIVFRFIQALGGCAGPVLGRAAVRDIHGPLEAARVLSYMGTAMAVAPAAAPILGGYLLIWFGWPSVFVFLAAYGVVAAALLWFGLPETLPVERRQAIHPATIATNYLTLLSSREYVGYTLSCSFVYAGLFAFLSGASFVLIRVLGVEPQHFGLFFTLAVGGYMLGTIIGGRLSRRLGIDRLLTAGSLLAAAAGLTMAALAMNGVYTIAAVMAPMAAFMVGVGIVMPQSLAGAIGPFPTMAGSASALLGFIQMAIAAGLGILVGQFQDGTPQPMALAIAFAGITTLLSFVLLVALPKRRLAPAAADGGP